MTPDVASLQQPMCDCADTGKRDCPRCGLLWPEGPSRPATSPPLVGIDTPVSHTYARPLHGWTCFHCGETFTTPGAARDHFGATPENTAGCLIDRVALEQGGTPERGRGLLMALRKAEQQLSDALARIEALKAVCAESNAVCACGCPADEHESYGEDGESCGDDTHECYRVPHVARAELSTLQSQLSDALATSERLQQENQELKESRYWDQFDWNFCPACGARLEDICEHSPARHP